MRLSIAGRQRASDARGGMPARVHCSEACSITARLTLGSSTAKRLKVPLGIATGEAALDDSGSTYVFLGFKSSVLKRVFRKGAVKATLALTVLDAAGNATTARRTRPAREVARVSDAARSRGALTRLELPARSVADDGEAQRDLASGRAAARVASRR